MCAVPEMSVEALTAEQVRDLYARRLTRDFPPDELKPLSRIEQAMTRGEYVCYGAVEGGAILAYAFFVLLGRLALFDYYAVDEPLRDRGIGSRFMRALIEGPLADMDCVLLEVDDPDGAEALGEVALRRRRLVFYLKNGLVETGVKATVYGVDFDILTLPVRERPSADGVRRMYARLYRAILPPPLYEKWVKIH